MNTDIKAVLPYQGRREIIQADHTTEDIVNEVMNAHRLFAPDYDKVAAEFWKGNQVDTIRGLYKYCKKRLPYRVESERSQTTRSPGAILRTANKIGVDCKHYAGFIGGILDALNRQGKNISWRYKFASYDVFNSTPEHVFIEAKIGGNTYWVDPVLPSFNQKDPGPFYSFSKRPRGQTLAGIPDENQGSGNILPLLLFGGIMLYFATR